MCCECLKKVRWGKVFLAGLVFLVIATIVRQVEAILTMKYYLMPEFFGVWSKVMMPKAGPPPASFFLTSLLFSLATGMTLAAFYDYIKNLLPKNQWQRMFCFTEIVVVLAFVFFSLPTYLLINLPLGLLGAWLVSTVVILFLATTVFVKLLK